MCAVIKVGQVAAAQLKQPQLEHYSMCRRERISAAQVGCVAAAAHRWHRSCM